MRAAHQMRRLLIANRGEIVTRIARTARRLGIATVGVYSDADADASFLSSVDVAVALGGTTPAESYLRGEAIIDAARRTAAGTVHPGYGFLAENADFAQAVLDAGLVWVGPPPEQIAALGNKVAAKQAAAEAGVPVAEGERYPLVVKATFGGGGRGMRVVRDPAELDAALAAARREAEAAFGDGAVFVEPFVERGRHVEVQVVGDDQGNVVHLGERECSIQRRHQKLIEESPSPGIDAATRAVLLDAALALAEHVGYRNAGTVEFLVGDDGTVQLLEVNTRLQVEHPITEAVTGLDVVELQLRVAAGELLPITQDDVAVAGHAIEARLVAEDPAAGWLPSAGPVRRFAIPDTVRVDTGVAAGDVVSPDYDSLLAKVIAHGSTRDEAAAALRHALAAAELHGPATNRDLVVAVLDEPDFTAGATFTRYLDDHPDVLAPAIDDDAVHLHLIAAALDGEAARHAGGPWVFAPSGWRNVRTQGQRSRWQIAGRIEPIAVEYTVAADGRYADVAVDGTAHRVRRTDLGDERSAVEVDGVRHVVAIHRAGETVWTDGDGTHLRLEELPRFADHARDVAGSGPVAPLPGTIVDVAVAAGDAVGEGALLVVLEAMKMEHRITAPTAATVTAVDVAVGDRVDAGEVLVHLEPRDG